MTICLLRCDSWPHTPSAWGTSTPSATTLTLLRATSYQTLLKDKQITRQTQWQLHIQTERKKLIKKTQICQFHSNQNTFPVMWNRILDQWHFTVGGVFCRQICVCNSVLKDIQRFIWIELFSFISETKKAEMVLLDLWIGKIVMLNMEAEAWPYS